MLDRQSSVLYRMPNWYTTERAMSKINRKYNQLQENQIAALILKYRVKII